MWMILLLNPSSFVKTFFFFQRCLRRKLPVQPSRQVPGGPAGSREFVEKAGRQTGIGGPGRNIKPFEGMELRYLRDPFESYDIDSGPQNVDPRPGNSPPWETCQDIGTDYPGTTRNHKSCELITVIAKVLWYHSKIRREYDTQC